ncbi:MAG TPA: hypothetical protein VLA84_11075 [Microcoleus sp.]|nr:hypothetical protein [Microcoleus sp.]
MAGFYNEVWGEELSKLALHLVEQLLLAHLGHLRSQSFKKADPS